MRILNVDFLGCGFYHFHSKDRNPAFSLLQNLRDIIEQFQIDRTFLLLEGGSKYRLSIHPEYKSARKKRQAEMTPAERARFKEFRDQIDELAENVAPMLCLTPLRVFGAEADDLAGYLCQHIDTTQHQVFNLSGDHDWYQLLRKNVVQASYAEIRKAGNPIPKGIWLSRSRFEQEYQIPVSNWIWQKCLAGDVGDSVPGINQLGEGTALALLQTYGSIDEIERQRETLHVPRMKTVAKEAIKTDFETVRNNYWVMNLCHSAKEEQAIFGAEGIAYLEAHIAGLSAPKEVQWGELQELVYERGWLDIDKYWVQPFLR